MIVQAQYNLWKCSELYPARPPDDPLQAGFIAGFCWAVALHDAALNTAQITGPRMDHITQQLKSLRDRCQYEAEHTKDSRHFARNEAAAAAYGHAYRLLVPMSTKGGESK